MEERAAMPSDGTDVMSLEVRVAGRVQGVGFRYFAHEVARRLQVVGYVVNQRDGSVRTYAEGPRAALESFLRQIERGPAGACVREVRSHWGPATGQHNCFSIERTT
jgi:acylphosphatase